jgi:hypothetical protein
MKKQRTKKQIREAKILKIFQEDSKKSAIKRGFRPAIKHRTPGLASLPAGLQNEWDDEI